MRKVAVIQDLSSFGKCSLTAAIPVLSVMGVQACPLPTAFFSAQTEYPSYYGKDLTAAMPFFVEEWRKLDVSFDGIHTGFINGKEQIHHILRFLETFHRDKTVLLVDPVMGDRGEAYANFDDELLAQMKTLSRQADLITPNITECCLLTGIAYDSLFRFSNESDYLRAIEEAGRQLQEDTGAKIIITGVQPPTSGNSQFVGNLYVDQLETAYSSVPYNGKSYSGTGDLFASVIMGCMMRGDSAATAITLAETFLTAAIRDTGMEGIPVIEGVNFEKFLGILL